MRTAAADVGTALADATGRLTSAGAGTPRLDAELLLGEALGVDRARLVLDSHRDLSDAERYRLAALLDRREQREPVAYILGRQAFRYIELAVDGRVLIPRPETELLVEAALDLSPGTRVVDVGTGCGAVALALKHERPDLDVVGVDVSPDALAVARDNARRLGLEVSFVESDLLGGVSGPEVVLANLPYVADGDLLPPEVDDHEPPGALLAGSDGLDVIRRLIGQLARSPMAALEVGLGQADAVGALLAEAGLSAVERRRDLAGIQRVVIGRR